MSPRLRTLAPNVGRNVSWVKPLERGSACLVIRNLNSHEHRYPISQDETARALRGCYMCGVFIVHRKDTISCLFFFFAYEFIQDIPTISATQGVLALNCLFVQIYTRLIARILPEPR